MKAVMFSTFNGLNRSNISLHTLSMHGSVLDSKQQEKFFDVVKKDDTKGLQKVVKKKGVDVNFLFRFSDYAEKMTALHYASIHGKLQVVVVLLGCKQVNVDTKTPFDESTALHFSCSNNDSNVAYALAEILVQSGADVNTIDHWEKTPLILAAQRGHLNVVQLLIRHGANLDHSYKIDDMPCVTSVSYVDNVLLKDPCYGNNALIQACRYHHTHIVHALIHCGSDVHVVNRNKSSSLHAAADLYIVYNRSKQATESNTGDPGIISLLIDRGIDVNGRDNAGLTPIARLLIALEYISSVPKPKQNSSILNALRIGQILVRAGSNVNGMYPNRSVDKCSSILNKLLTAGEFLLKYDDKFINEEFTNFVRLLVTARCPMNVHDIEIATSLHLPELTDLLLSYFDKPLPLKLLCVGTIRQHTRQYSLEKHLRKLHLPELLKQLVCFDIN